MIKVQFSRFLFRSSRPSWSAGWTFNYAHRLAVEHRPVMHWKLFVHGPPTVTIPSAHMLVSQLLLRHSLLAVHMAPMASRASVHTRFRQRMEVHWESSVQAAPTARPLTVVVVAAVVAVVVVTPVELAVVVAVAESAQRMLVHVIDWQSVAAKHMPPSDIWLAAQLPSTQNVDEHWDGLAHVAPLAFSVGVAAAHVPLTQLLDMHWVETRQVAPMLSRVTHWLPLVVDMQYCVIMLHPSAENGVGHWLVTQRRLTHVLDMHSMSRWQAPLVSRFSTHMFPLGAGLQN